MDVFNQGPAGLVVVCPLTTTARRQRFHVRIVPPEGGVRQASFIKCEDVRSVSGQRLIGRWGRITAGTMADVEDRLRTLLDL